MGRRRPPPRREEAHRGADRRRREDPRRRRARGGPRHLTDATTAPKMPAGADADGARGRATTTPSSARPLALQLLGAARGGGALELEARGGFWSRDHSLEGLRARVHAFARARDWQPFHTPRNLCLALGGEVCARASAPLSSPSASQPASSERKRRRKRRLLPFAALPVKSGFTGRRAVRDAPVQAGERRDARPRGARARRARALQRGARRLHDLPHRAVRARARRPRRGRARRARAHPHQSAEPRRPSRPAARAAARVPAHGRAARRRRRRRRGRVRRPRRRRARGDPRRRGPRGRARRRGPPTRFDELRAASARRDAAACAKPRARARCARRRRARGRARGGVRGAGRRGRRRRRGRARGEWTTRAPPSRRRRARLLAALVRVAVAAHIDLGSACARKLVLNDRKYPADVVRGSSKKYSEYQTASK